MGKAGSWGMKVESLCKQCGRTFVRYAYEKYARCEECRRINRAAAFERSAKGRIKKADD